MTGQKQITHYPLAPKIQIILTTEPELELPVSLEDEIELIWLKEKAKHNLYNSLLFSLSAFDEHRLIGRFIEYRYYIASRHSRKLQEQLQIFPLGISALTLSNDHLLVGTRDMKLPSFGGFTECVPSGGIEARAYMQGEVDFIAQAMWELQEEARISEKQVNEVHQVGLFYSPHEGVYDIGLVIRLNGDEFDREPDGTNEYPLLKWYSFEEWEEKLESSAGKIVPLSKMLWSTYRKK